MSIKLKLYNETLVNLEKTGYLKKNFRRDEGICEKFEKVGNSAVIQRYGEIADKCKISEESVRKIVKKLK